jgi:nitroreductase
MNVSDAIRSKRAIRKFEQKPLPEDAVRAILQAGRRAQSSKNSQPWHFVAVRERETLTALSKMGTYAGHMAGAALGVVFVTVDPAVRWAIMFDSGQSASYMQLQAWEMGIGSCLATIYEPDQARALLGVPPELTIHVAISFGYPDPAELAPRPPKPGARRPLEDVVHWEKW